MHLTQLHRTPNHALSQCSKDTAISRRKTQIFFIACSHSDWREIFEPITLRSYCNAKKKLLSTLTGKQLTQHNISLRFPSPLYQKMFKLAVHVDHYIYILLTKREGRTGRISARGLDSTDLAALGPYKEDRGPIFSQYGPEQAWLIRDLLYY